MAQPRRAHKTYLEVAQVFVKMSFCMLGDRSQVGEGCTWRGSPGCFDVAGILLSTGSLILGGSGGCFSPCSQGLLVGMFCFAYITPKGRGDRQEMPGLWVRWSSARSNSKFKSTSFSNPFPLLLSSGRAQAARPAACWHLVVQNISFPFLPDLFFQPFQLSLYSRWLLVDRLLKKCCFAGSKW